MASIAYGQRNDYIVQADVNWAASKAVISSLAAAGNTPSSAGGLSVYFTKGSQVSLYNGVSETATGIDTGILATDTSWHNLAVGFNKTAGNLSVYVDQSLKGTLNLSTFAGGAYASYSNAAVGVGSTTGGLVWTDNFQVGGTTAWPDTPLPARESRAFRAAKIYWFKKDYRFMLCRIIPNTMTPQRRSLMPPAGLSRISRPVTSPTVGILPT